MTKTRANVNGSPKEERKGRTKMSARKRVKPRAQSTLLKITTTTSPSQSLPTNIPDNTTQPQTSQPHPTMFEKGEASSSRAKHTTPSPQRDLHHEQGFPQSAAEVPSSIMATLMNRGWVDFGAPPLPAIKALVQEFYLALPMLQDGKLEIRGKVVEWSPSSINRALGLPVAKPCQFSSLIKRPSHTTLQAVLSTVAVPEAVWRISKQGARTVAAAMLKPSLAPWMYFIKSRLLPTTHDHTVAQDRVFMLYCLAEGLYVDVGIRVYEAVLECSRKSKGKLFFPGTITQICLKNKTPVEKDEGRYEGKTVIDGKTIARLVKNLEEGGGKLTFEERMLQVVAELSAKVRRQEEKLNEYFKYCAKRDGALQSALRNITRRPMTAAPRFPTDIIEELSDASASEGSSDSSRA